MILGEYSRRSATLTFSCACGATYETSTNISGVVAGVEAGTFYLSIDYMA
jgi:hypothetical protein